jgi:hypothetical protein
MNICDKENIIKEEYNDSIIRDIIRKDYGLYNINNIKTNLNVCTEIFNGPIFTSNLTQLMTGLTESSIGVFNITNTGMTFDYTFTGNLPTITAYTGTFDYKVYPRSLDVVAPQINISGPAIPNSEFDPTPTYTNSIDFSAITNNSFMGSDVLLLQGLDQEYILNSNYTFFKKECRDKTKQTNPNNDNLYVDGETLYFVTLLNPEVPILGPFTTLPPRTPEILTVTRKEREGGDDTYVFGVPAALDSNTINCKLVTETIDVDNIYPDIFTISNTPVEDTLMVSVNGITLSPIDYTISSSTIVTLSKPLSPGIDIVTFTYLTCDNKSNVTYSEKYEITGITSGPTSAYTSNLKVYYNTTELKSEYYLDKVPQDPENILLFLNGVKLTYGLDFLISNTVNNRLIFYGYSLNVNDIIHVIYLGNGVVSGDYGLVTTKNPLLEWRISTPLVINDRLNGEFLVEVTEVNDPTFTSTATTKQVIVDYVAGQTTFSTGIPEDLNQNTNYLWRVTSKKVYSGLLSNIFITESVSGVGKFYTNILPY